MHPMRGGVAGIEEFINVLVASEKNYSSNERGGRGRGRVRGVCEYNSGNGHVRVLHALFFSQLMFAAIAEQVNGKILLFTNGNTL